MCNERTGEMSTSEWDFEKSSFDSGDLRVSVVVVDGHDYIVVGGVGGAAGAGIIHSASCPACSVK